MQAGLSGYCDYILTASKEAYEIRTLVVTLAEAKNESIKSGLGQCIAQMVAAQLFNQRNGEAIANICGAVTTGTEKDLPSEQLKRPYRAISEDEILKQLTECEQRFKDGFVGLRYFVTEILASQGYSYSPSYAVINILADKKKIKIYDVENPYVVMPTKAIKLLNKEVESIQ